MRTFKSPEPTCRNLRFLRDTKSFCKHTGHSTTPSYIWIETAFFFQPLGVCAAVLMKLSIDGTLAMAPSRSVYGVTGEGGKKRLIYGKYISYSNGKIHKI